MEIRLLTSTGDLRKYDAWLRAHPEGSLWQSLQWKQFQEALGRTVRIYAAMEADQIAASALVVMDATSFGLRTWEIPYGPLGSEKLKVKNEKLDTEEGTRKITEGILKTNAYTVVGGGDTVEYLNKLGVLDKFSFASTGGGAMLSFLSGEKLPGIEALRA